MSCFQTPPPLESLFLNYFLTFSTLSTCVPQVTVLVGQPIQLDDLVSKYVQEGLPKPALYDAVALRVRQNMKDLKEELDHLVLERDIQDAGDAARTATIIKKLQAVFQFVDWEAQGFLFQYTSPEAEREISLQISNKSSTTPQGEILSHWNYI